MNTAAVRLACVATGCALVAVKAPGAITLVLRDNNYQVAPGDAFFSNAVFTPEVVHHMTADTPGDTRVFTFGRFPGQTDFQVVGTGGMGVSDVSLPTASTYSFRATSPAGAPGAVTVKLVYPGDTSALFRETIGGRAALHYRSNSSGGLDLGGTYRFQFTIDGDWHSLGTGTGQLEFINFNPNWTIDTLWEFNPMLGPFGQTVFVAHIDNYGSVPNSTSPSPEFRLWGAPVPSPTVGSVLVAAVVCAVRRRRA